MTVKRQSGFSLIGVLISMFIFIVGMVGILSVANFAIKSASVSKMKLIASGLAQEGVEVIRGNREVNEDWDDWTWYSDAIATSTTQDFRVEYDGDVLAYDANAPLKYDLGTGLYQYTDGNDTLFYRKVTLTKISYKEVKLAVEMKWQAKGNTHYLIVEDRLWNWK